MSRTSHILALLACTFVLVSGAVAHATSAPVLFITGQSNAQILYHSGAVQDRLSAMGQEARVVLVAGGGESVAAPDGAWNIVTGDGEDRPGRLYSEFLDTVAQITADTPDADIAGMIWVQGEADAYSMLPYYQTTRALFEAMRRDTRVAFPIAVVSLSDFHNLPDGPREHVQQAQWQLSVDLDDVAFIDTDAIIAENALSKAFVMRDELHYNLDFYPFVAGKALNALFPSD